MFHQQYNNTKLLEAMKLAALGVLRFDFTLLSSQLQRL